MHFVVVHMLRIIQLTKAFLGKILLATLHRNIWQSSRTLLSIPNLKDQKSKHRKFSCKASKILKTLPVL